MNAGEFDKRITVLQHTRDADGNYSLVPAYKRWAKIEETADNCVYSNYAFGVKAAHIDTRLLNIPCGTFISYPPNTYLITACITDRMYSHITAAGVILSQCTASRYTTEKDELNRQRSDLRRLFSFPAVIGEKYVRPIEYITHGEVERGVVLTTHKDIGLLEGDIVKTGDDTYIIRACHTQDPDKNDYEAERKRDV